MRSAVAVDQLHSCFPKEPPILSSVTGDSVFSAQHDGQVYEANPQDYYRKPRQTNSKTVFQGVSVGVLPKRIS